MPNETLPDFAKAPWPTPDPGAPPPRAPQPPRPDPLATQITETHQGVQNLQVLVQPKEGEDPSKIDLLLDGQETIIAQQKALSEGLDLLFYRLHELYRSMGLKIPAPPKKD